MKKIFTPVRQVLFRLFSLFKGIACAFASYLKASFFSNTDSAYPITDTDFDLNTFFKGVTIEKVGINPYLKQKYLLLLG